MEDSETVDPLSWFLKHLFLQYVLSIFVSSGVNKFQPVIGAMHHTCVMTCVQQMFYSVCFPNSTL